MHNEFLDGLKTLGILLGAVAMPGLVLQLLMRGLRMFSRRNHPDINWSEHRHVLNPKL